LDTTPVTLLDRLRTPGDEEAWRRLVELVTPLLLAWARRVGMNRDDAADLAQEVFAVLVKELPTFQYDPSRSFRAWLKTVTMNKCRQRGRRAGIGVDADARLDEIAAPDVDTAWEHEYRHQLVLRAFETIKGDVQHRTWQACWELIVAGRDAADVAAELDLTPGAVYVAKCRVLRRLRQVLEGMLDDEPCA
jgi:RNA polymerase sigma-70 factor (ECF subfamily)